MHSAWDSSDIHSGPHRRLLPPPRARPLVGMNAISWPFAETVSRLGVPESGHLVSNRRVVAVEDVSAAVVQGAIGTGGSPMTTTSRFGRAALGWCLAAVVLSGCTEPSPEPTGSSTRTPTAAPSTATPTPTTDPEIVAAEEAILEAYYGYWAAKVASYADPTQAQDPNLQVFADDTALTDAQTTIFTLRSNGIVIPGEPVLSPVVSDIVLAPAATAAITDCVDAANWQPIYSATGESAAAPDQALRVVTESTAFVIDGTWRIRTSVVHRDQTC